MPHPILHLPPFHLYQCYLYFIPCTFIPFIRFSTFSLQLFLIFPLFRFHQSFNLSIPPLTPCPYTAFIQQLHTTSTLCTPQHRILKRQPLFISSTLSAFLSFCTIHSLFTLLLNTHTPPLTFYTFTTSLIILNYSGR